MAAAEPTSSAQPTPQAQAQAQAQPPPHGVPSSQPSAVLAAGSSRHEKSLGLLTTKFVSLLQEAQDGVLDLKTVSGDGEGEAGGSSVHRHTPPRLRTGRCLGRGGTGMDAGPPPPGHRAALATKKRSERPRVRALPWAHLALVCCWKLMS